MKREILEKPFDKSLVKTRKGSFGQSLAYVEGAEYIKRLNEAFDAEWSFEIVERKVDFDNGEVIVLGKLRAGGVEKSAFGGSSITVSKTSGEVVSIADDLKAAATDSLKKACTLFGIGLELYSNGHSEVSEAKTAPVARPRPVKGERLTQAQLSAIWKIGRNLGLNAEQIRQLAVNHFGTSPEQLSKADASSLITKLAEELDEKRGAA